MPAYRTASGVTLNPFRDVPREAVVERMVTISLEDLRSWLRNASYHIRLAVAIAALAPKLRLANVLALTWNEHIDPDLSYITVHRHKTVATLRRPQVVPISDQLKVILKDARRAPPPTSSSTGAGPSRRFAAACGAPWSVRGSRSGAPSTGPPSTRCGTRRRPCWRSSASQRRFGKRSWVIATSRRRSGTRICAPSMRFRPMNGWPTPSPLPTWSPRRASARAVSLLGQMLGLRVATRTNSMLGPSQRSSTNMPYRNSMAINAVRVRTGGPVGLLGLLLGLTQGHLKKLQQRQGQIENSGNAANSAKPCR